MAIDTPQALPTELEGEVQKAMPALVYRGKIKIPYFLIFICQF